MAALRKLRTLLVMMVAVVIICVAIAFNLLRLGLPYLNQYTRDIGQAVSDQLGRQVVIGQLDAAWEKFSPRFKLLSVNVFDGQELLFYFEEVNFSLDWWNSLRRLTPLLGEVVIKGTDIEIRRTQEGLFEIQGLPIQPPRNQGEAVSSLQYQLSRADFYLEESIVRWHDELRQHPPRVLSRVNISLQSDEPHYKVVVDVELPKHYGASLNVIAELNIADGFSLWEGRVYVKGRGLNLGNLMAESKDYPLGLEGVMDTDLWGHWRKGRLEMVSGRFELDKLSVFDVSQSQNKWQAEHAATWARWERGSEGWQLQLQDLHVRRQPQEIWPGKSTVAIWHRPELTETRIAANFLRLQDLSSLLQVLPIDPDWREGIRQASPYGDLRKLYVELTGSALLDNLRMNVNFDELGLRLPKHRIAFSGLDGQLFHMGRNTLLNLDSRDAELEFGRIFRAPMFFEVLKSDISLSHSEEGWHIHSPWVEAYNEDAVTASRMDILIPVEGSPFLDLRTDFRDAQVSQAWKYLPVNRLPGPVVDWLDKALVKGVATQGGFLLHGPIKSFPFRGGEGVLQVDFDVKDVELRYVNNWPEIEAIQGKVRFLNESLSVQRARGKIFNTQLRNTELLIRQLGRPFLEITGQAKGTVDDMLRYLVDSSLLKWPGDGTALFSLAGNAGLDLRLQIPLGKAKQDKIFSVGGNLRLEGSDAYFLGQKVAFEELFGDVAFDGLSVTSPRLIGRLNSRAVDISVTPKVKKSGIENHVDINGKFAMHDLLHNFGLDLGLLMQGEADWKIGVTIPDFRHSSESRLEVVAESGLQGIEVKLPEPLAKNLAAESSFVTQVKLLDTELQVNIDYDEQLSAALAWPPDNLTGIRGDIRVNSGAARLRQDGISLEVALPRASWNQWWQTFERRNPEETSPEPMSESLRAVKLDIGELEIAGQHLQSFKLNAKRDKDTWALTLASKQMSGSASVPTDFSTGKPLAFGMDYVRLPDIPDAGGMGLARENSEILPSAIPPIQLTINELQIKDWQLNDVELVTSRHDKGMMIDRLRLKGPSMEASARGAWLQSLPGSSESSMHIEISSSNFGKMLSGFGYSRSVDKARGDAEFNWQWEGGPHQFNWDTLKGAGRLKLDKGQLPNLDPGAGRILGLLSFQALPRRLSLDFGDIFGKGFSFDQITGTFDFANGNAHTQDFEITGPAADVFLRGRIGLSARDYDQHITVAPHVTRTLPLLGVAGGVPGVAAVAVLQQLLGVGEASQIRYSVTGPWDDPKVVNLRRKSGAPQLSPPNINESAE